MNERRVSGPIFREAGFRDRSTGRVYGSGPTHRWHVLPGGGRDAERFESGYVDQRGRFLTRERAEKLATRVLVLLFLLRCRGVVLVLTLSTIGRQVLLGRGIGASRLVAAAVMLR